MFESLRSDQISTLLQGFFCFPIKPSNGHIVVKTFDHDEALFEFPTEAKKAKKPNPQRHISLKLPPHETYWNTMN